MIANSPFRYDGPDIDYPEKGIIFNGELKVNNYLPDVLKRGLREIGGFANKLEPNPGFPVILGSRDSPIFQRITENGLATRLGLPYLDAQAVHASAIQLARLLSNEETLTEDETRGRTALLGYVAVAESQTLAMANKRAGRVIYGRIRYGVGQENIKRGIDAVLDDTVPSEIEGLVLLQNISRCMNDSEPAVTEFGGVYVEEEVIDRLERQRGIIDTYRISSNTSQFLHNFDFNILQLNKKLNSILEEEKLAQRTAAVLMQEDYGPAAWLLHCENRSLEELTADTAHALIATNSRLLQMRIVVLVNSIANGGKFVTITDSKDECSERKVKITHWMPEERLVQAPQE